MPLRIANARGVPGTVGAVVHDEAASYLLVAHHVAFGDGAAVGDPVWAIDADGAAIAIGNACRGQLGRVSFGAGIYFVDCALVAMTDLTGAPAWLVAALADLRALQTSATGAPGMAVCKHGAATGTTHGVVLDIGFVDEPVIAGRSWVASEQLLVESTDARLYFSAKGDSGAALLDDRGQVVGVLWGTTSDGRAIASPIAPVLDCLAVRL